MKTYTLFHIYDSREPYTKDTGYYEVSTASQTDYWANIMCRTTNEGGSTTYTRQLNVILSKIPSKYRKIRAIISDTDEDYIHSIHKAFRPEPRMGWNIRKASKRGTPRAFVLIGPDGDTIEFKSMMEARRAGWNDGQISRILNGTRSTIRGYTAEYV